jgi:hypothetical protein
MHTEAFRFVDPEGELQDERSLNVLHYVGKIMFEDGVSRFKAYSGSLQSISVKVPIGLYNSIIEYGKITKMYNGIQPFMKASIVQYMDDTYETIQRMNKIYENASIISPQMKPMSISGAEVGQALLKILEAEDARRKLKSDDDSK